MNKLISFRYPDWKNRWEFFVDWDTKVVTVIVTFISDFRPAPEFGIGTAMRSPEDEFDLRVGVPLALKRALGKIVAVDRLALTKRFFRQWPEAHPEYKQAKFYLPKAGGMVTQITVIRGGEGPTGEVMKVTDVRQVPYVPPPVREFSICDSCGATHEVVKYPCP